VVDVLRVQPDHLALTEPASQADHDGYPVSWADDVANSQHCLPSPHVASLVRRLRPPHGVRVHGIPGEPLVADSRFQNGYGYGKGRILANGYISSNVRVNRHASPTPCRRARISPQTYVRRPTLRPLAPHDVRNLPREERPRERGRTDQRGPLAGPRPAGAARPGGVAHRAPFPAVPRQSREPGTAADPPPGFGPGPLG
jgi:hypothetical protein